MQSELRDLYQEVILDHSKRPRNFGRLGEPTSEARGNNPLCGDRLTVYVTVADGKVTGVSFEGDGCAISKASASVMTEAVAGMTMPEVKALFERFHGVVTGKDGSLDDLDKLAVFAGVAEFPVRVKCATLPWHTLVAALEGAKAAVSTE